MSVTELAIAEIDPSPLNPRKTIDESHLKELAEDIKQRGVLQNVIVRAKPKGRYELVVGERRYRAAKLAGLETLPSSIVEMDDGQALETMLVENAQRADVEPLEEAEAYQALMKHHGYTADELGAKVSKSRSWIYGRLRLLELVPEVRKAIQEDRLSVSVAMAVGRLPKNLQKEALRRVAADQWEAALPYRRAVDVLDSEFNCALKNAKWKLDDAELVPDAGPCSTCDKRSGNQPELLDIGGKRPDVCTDRACFGGKGEAWANQRLEEARAKGHQVLAPADAKKIFAHGRVKDSAKFVDADARDYRDYTKGRTWRQVTKAKKEDLVLAINPDGKLVELIPTKGIDERIRKAGNRYLEKKGSGSSSSSPDRAKTIAKNRLARETRRRQLEAIREATASAGPEPHQDRKSRGRGGHRDRRHRAGRRSAVDERAQNVRRRQGARRRPGSDRATGPGRRRQAREGQGVEEEDHRTQGAQQEGDPGEAEEGRAPEGREAMSGASSEFLEPLAEELDAVELGSLTFMKAECGIYLSRPDGSLLGPCDELVELIRRLIDRQADES